MRIINAIALVLMIVGAINWGLVGLFEYDLVAVLAGLEFGEVNALTRTIYSLVGVAGLYGLYLLVEEFITERRPTGGAARGMTR